MGGLHRLARLGLVEMLGVPAAQHQGHGKEQQASHAEPGHMGLAERDDDGCRQQRAEGRACVATDLKGRLRQAETPT
ncbi:hypothetical protein D3C79_879820 [compost metagenome]